MLSKEYPTIAFHASLTHAFGKSALINTLRQFAKLHADSKQISVGLLGYPNVGKSSVINTLRGIKVCNVAPIPGETKVWQYVTLMKRIYLIDSPGVVRPTRTADETECVLKGVVRVEHLKCPEMYIAAVLERVRPQYLIKAYRMASNSSWRTATEFLELLARKCGRLLKVSRADCANRPNCCACAAICFPVVEGACERKVRLNYCTASSFRRAEFGIRNSAARVSVLGW